MSLLDLKATMKEILFGLFDEPRHTFSVNIHYSDMCYNDNQDP